VNMAKYRKLQQEMEGAVERADMAENTLGQLRARNRSASVAPESTTTFGLTVSRSYLAAHLRRFLTDGYRVPPPPPDKKVIHYKTIKHSYKIVVKPANENRFTRQIIASIKH